MLGEQRGVKDGAGGRRDRRGGNLRNRGSRERGGTNGMQGMLVNPLEMSERM